MKLITLISRLRKKLVIDDEYFTVDDLVDILTQTPKGMTGGLLLNFPDPLTPKLLGDIIEADNAVVIHVLSPDANYVNGDAYKNELNSVDQMVTDEVISQSDADDLKTKLFQKHFEYDYGFMQWINSKSAEYHKIWFKQDENFEINIENLFHLITGEGMSKQLPQFLCMVHRKQNYMA